VEATTLARLGKAAMATSFVSLIVILGMMVGLSTVETPGSIQLAASGQMELQDSMSLPSDNPHSRAGSVPLEQSLQAPSWSVMGSSTVLPAIDMSPIGFHRASLDPVPWGTIQLASAP